jgi:D-galactarolactone cycloisomerase
MEYDETVNPLRTELLKEPLVVENGYLLIPSRTPGLGVELHRDTVERFPFIDDEAVEKHEYKPR